MNGLAQAIKDQNEHWNRGFFISLLSLSFVDSEKEWQHQCGAWAGSHESWMHTLLEGNLHSICLSSHFFCYWLSSLWNRSHEKSMRRRVEGRLHSICLSSILLCYLGFPFLFQEQQYWKANACTTHKLCSACLSSHLHCYLGCLLLGPDIMILARTPTFFVYRQIWLWIWWTALTISV